MTTSSVSREARFLIWLTIAGIAPFGLLLVLYPRAAGDFWAWEIAQPRTAVLVGAIYFASAFYYGMLSTQRRWLPIQASARATCSGWSPSTGHTA
jgi:hypothetical protein